MARDRAYHTRRQQARQKRQQQVKRHRCERAREHLQREQTRAQRYLRALEQAMVELGLPEVLAADREWRLKTLGKLLGNIFGLMFPTLFGCQTIAELTRGRRWDKNLPAKLLGALPKRKWVRRLQHVGQAVLVQLWQQVEAKSPATRSRWQWTWVGDDSIVKKYGQPLGLVGTW